MKKIRKKDEETGRSIIVLGHSLIDDVVSILHKELNGLLSEMSIIFNWFGSPDACDAIVDKVSANGGALRPYYLSKCHF